jgi:hypothetical protein
VVQETDLEDEWHRQGLNCPSSRRVAQSEAWTDLEAAWNRAMFAAFAELQKKREAAHQKAQEPGPRRPPSRRGPGLDEPQA